ncbi:MAG: SDR family NAD(P)-dependent oxidoreductase [Pseudomonadota bacterium]
MALPQGIDWITGASSGIGKALALKMAAEGRTVVISARSEEDLKTVAVEADGLPGKVIPSPLDITDEAAVTAAVAEIEEEHGPLAVAVLNAGTHKPVLAADMTVADFELLARLNLLGTVACLIAALKPMQARGRGQIAVVASVAGYIGLPTSAAYGMTKAGLINMTQALQPDLAAKGVTLQLVNPGFVKTPLTDKNEFPMPFLMQPDKAAERFYQGLESGRFEIVFPWRLAFILKILRALPMGLMLKVTKRMQPT